MYTVKENYVNVLGYMWLPNSQATYRYDLRQYAIDNMKDDEEKITRESVENWLSMNAGDFQSITDFYAIIDNESVVIDWEKEENEITFNDIQFPVEDY